MELALPSQRRHRLGALPFKFKLFGPALLATTQYTPLCGSTRESDGVPHATVTVAPWAGPTVIFESVRQMRHGPSFTERLESLDSLSAHSARAVAVGPGGLGGGFQLYVVAEFYPPLRLRTWKFPFGPLSNIIFDQVFSPRAMVL